MRCVNLQGTLFILSKEINHVGFTKLEEIK